SDIPQPKACKCPCTYLKRLVSCRNWFKLKFALAEPAYIPFLYSPIITGNPVLLIIFIATNPFTLVGYSLGIVPIRIFSLLTYSISCIAFFSNLFCLSFTLFLLFLVILCYDVGILSYFIVFLWSFVFIYVIIYNIMLCFS